MKSLTAVDTINGRYAVDQVTGCWVWTGPIDHYGYGYLSEAHKKIKAHRRSYETYVGPISDGEVIRHRCDNNPCVNPEHLLTRTRPLNSADMVERNRSQHGTNHYNAKLTIAQIKEILTIVATQGYHVSVIAAHFDVSRNTIWRIATGKHRALRDFDSAELLKAASSRVPEGSV